MTLGGAGRGGAGRGGAGRDGAGRGGAGRGRPVRSLAALLAFAALALGVPPSATPASAATPARAIDAVIGEAEYILDMYLGNGMIATRPDRMKVVPYHANFAVIGLAKAFTVVPDRRYAQIGWRWLEWYRDHMLPDGTMPDWVYASDWIPTGDPDSTDAYAGTFLSAVLAMFQATGDVQKVNGLRGAVHMALGAIELTEDSDGLHFAKPGYPFKLTMDEAEAYAGFRAAETLGGLLRDESIRLRAKADADRLLAGSVNLVDPATGLYLWALHADGSRTPAPLEWIYPGASAQVWAIAGSLVTGPAARTLMERVEAAQPSWDRPSAITQYYPGHPNCAGGPPPCMLPVEYWPRFALAWLQLGEARRAVDAAFRIRDGARAANRAFPFTPGDAGQLIMVFADPDAMLATVSPVRLPAT